MHFNRKRKTKSWVQVDPPHALIMHALSVIVVLNMSNESHSRKSVGNGFQSFGAEEQKARSRCKEKVVGENIDFVTPNLPNNRIF